MSRAQDLRNKAYSTPSTAQEIEVEKNKQLGQEYFNMTLDLIESLVNKGLIKGDLKIIYSAAYFGYIDVSTEPFFKLSLLPGKYGKTNKKFNIEAFKIMKELFANEEGYSVHISTDEKSSEELGNSIIYRITVTMHQK